jgi:hypothetical protein
LSIALEIIENYGGLWNLCPYTRSYLLYLRVITGLREWFPRKRICGIVMSRRYHRRGPVSVRIKGETGIRVSSSWAGSFHGSIPPKNSRAARQASWFPTPDHPLARILPCHVTGKHVTGREPKTPKLQRSTSDAMERIRRQREQYNTIHEFLIHFCLTL